MQIKFRSYERRDGTLMLYINRSNGVSVGVSPDHGFGLRKNMTPGKDNAVDAAKRAFFANAVPFTGDLSKHSEDGFCSPVECGPYTLVGTDVANIGGMDVSSDGGYVVRDGKICPQDEWLDEDFSGENVMMAKAREIRDLDHLLDLMKADAVGEDWSDLPNFGGPWPDDTAEVWSWDETRMITGTDSNNLTIETREEVAIWQKEFQQ